MDVYVILYKNDSHEECYQNKIYPSYEKALMDFRDEYMDYNKNWGIYKAQLSIAAMRTDRK